MPQDQDVYVVVAGLGKPRGRSVISSCLFRLLISFFPLVLCLQVCRLSLDLKIISPYKHFPRMMIVYIRSDQPIIRVTELTHRILIDLRG